MTCEPWPILWPAGDRPAGTTEVIEAAARHAAEFLLWSRTGRRIGVCRTRETFLVDSGCYVPGRGLASGGALDRRTIMLSSGPVQAVHAVEVNGGALSSASWSWTGEIVQLRTGSWSGEVTVDYSHGIPIGSRLWGAVAGAMGEVATEFLHGFTGGVCKLPGRTSAVTRAGVTVTLGESPTDSMKLGLPLADELIGSLNPNNLHSRSQVYSADLPPPIRRQSVPGLHAAQVGGVSTIAMHDGYEGSPYSFTITFPDASILAGGVGVVDAQVKPAAGGATVATFTPSIAGAVLTLTLGAAPAPGDYVFDVSVAGVTYITRTPWHVNGQVSS